MQQQLSEIEARALTEIAAVIDAGQLTELKIAYLGKKGELTGLSRTMGQLTAEERPLFGAAVNRAKDAVEAAFSIKMAELNRAGNGGAASS